MGYIKHDAVFVVTNDYRPGGLPDIDGFRASLPPEYRSLIVGPIQHPINGDVNYVAFLPDGSKEGWDTSDEVDEIRERFKLLFSSVYADGSSHDSVVHVEFGHDDYSPATIISEHPRLMVVDGELAQREIESGGSTK